MNALDTADGKRTLVRSVFATIADRYDLITVLLSYGRDARWKRRVVELSGARAGLSALDLACGTGDIAFALAERGARVTGLDITHRMLELARAKRRGGVSFVTGDMMALPFPDARFDTVTTGYGIRNVPVIQPAVAEIARVLKRGGVLVSLDFNRPSNPLVRAVYLTYLTIVGSALGLVLHGDPDTYRYIAASIKRYPGAAAVRDLIVRQGFASCEYIPVLGGLMAIHVATR